MDILKVMKISTSGMKAQGVRMLVVAENLANADNIPTEPGGECRALAERALGLTGRLLKDRIGQKPPDDSP